MYNYYLTIVLFIQYVNRTRRVNQAIRFVIIEAVQFRIVASESAGGRKILFEEEVPLRVLLPA